jgi:1-acyl-sn-glycerol-3-phosphate acyltransferase
MGGQAEARRTFGRVARGLADVFGVVAELDGELDDETHEVRVANHTSYLDILVLAGVDAGRFFSRHDVETWPMVGEVAKRIGTLFVDRESKLGRAVSLRSLARAAADGAPVVIFPEGRTGDGDLLPFQHGAFAVAKTARVPIRPLAIAYDDIAAIAWVGDATLGPHAWARLCGDYVVARVIVLPTLDPRSSAREASDEARAKIASVLGRNLASPTDEPKSA